MHCSEPIRILIADDHPVVREGLAALIERREDMTVVGEASNGVEAIELFRARRPDVTLMDLRMPLLDGVAATKKIREEYPNARIIMLTNYDGDEDIYRGLRVGIRAYLLKDASREEMVETIRAVHGGQTHLPADIAEKLAYRLSGPELTPREIEVVAAMAAGMSNVQIGAALHITEGTVKTHVNSILSKLDVSDRTQAVTTALRRGIVRLP